MCVCVCVHTCVRVCVCVCVCVCVHSYTCTASSLPPQLQFHVSVLRALRPLLIHSHTHQHFLVSPVFCTHTYNPSHCEKLYIHCAEDGYQPVHIAFSMFTLSCIFSTYMYIYMYYRHTAHSTAAHSPGHSLWEDNEDHQIHRRKVEDSWDPHGL